MITNILAYVDGRGSEESAAETAFHLAIRHEAHVEGLHVRVDARNFVTNAPVYSGVESLERFTESFDREAEELEKRATDAFTQARERHGVVEQEAATPVTRPTAHLTVVVGQASRTVSETARVSDVCVVGRVNYGRDNPTTPVIEAALFDSGRPVVIAPPQPAKSAGGDIVIAWNRSAAAARALNAAMPLFDKADRIRLVYVDTGAKAGPSADQAAAYVERHGFNVETATLKPHSNEPASTLLWYAQEADLLVMGAYSHSRLRELVLGGVTRHILENATIPVLMVH
jgi:nucleotide-binding universal stress UspA family protein